MKPLLTPEIMDTLIRGLVSQLEALQIKVETMEQYVELGASNHARLDEKVNEHIKNSQLEYEVIRRLEDVELSVKTLESHDE